MQSNVKDNSNPSRYILINVIKSLPANFLIASKSDTIPCFSRSHSFHELVIVFPTCSAIQFLPVSDMENMRCLVDYS